VTVLARKDNKTARIHISDTGIGIPEDELDYIFNRFYRVSKSRGVNHGFGLGLSRAKAIAEAHRGAIAAESRYGKGSTFTITLPLSYQG
jgi:two-component system phosphate regulon sensor histidine kinase PhoR